MICVIFFMSTFAVYSWQLAEMSFSGQRGWPADGANPQVVEPCEIIGGLSPVEECLAAWLNQQPVIKTGKGQPHLRFFLKKSHPDRGGSYANKPSDLGDASGGFTMPFLLQCFSPLWTSGCWTELLCKWEHVPLVFTSQLLFPAHLLFNISSGQIQRSTSWSDFCSSKF